MRLTPNRKTQEILNGRDATTTWVGKTFEETMNTPETDVEVEEESAEEITTLTHMCTACFDQFAEADLKGNLNDCPTCGEENITEI